MSIDKDQLIRRFQSLPLPIRIGGIAAGAMLALALLVALFSKPPQEAASAASSSAPAPAPANAPASTTTSAPASASSSSAQASAVPVIPAMPMPAAGIEPGAVLSIEAINGQGEPAEVFAGRVPASAALTVPAEAAEAAAATAARWRWRWRFFADLPAGGVAEALRIECPKDGCFVEAEVRIDGQRVAAGRRSMWDKGAIVAGAHLAPGLHEVEIELEGSTNEGQPEATLAVRAQRDPAPVVVRPMIERQRGGV